MENHPEDSDNFEDFLSFDDILKMTREQADRVVGARAWDIAHLNRLVNQALETVPEPPAKPPSFFVSYRWESEAHRAWVKRLVQDLKRRGYDVYFDQDIQSGRDQELPAPELISLVTRVNRFLIVWTEGYRERVEGEGERPSLQDGWVWDEYQMAIYLYEFGRIKSWMIVWRSGELPDWASEDQVWDFRDDASYERLVAEAFPIRLARIIGVRPDGSTLATGPIERVQVNEVGRQMEATGEFEYFLIEHQ